mmetsp:Transcript_51369/g.107314  ORF Transcript_51369/g.107314 Transcript_51369/m.107314 type:complete len:122 (-) Transcript_51369:135-500(-)
MRLHHPFRFQLPSTLEVIVALSERACLHLIEQKLPSKMQHLSFANRIPLDPAKLSQEQVRVGHGLQEYDQHPLSEQSWQYLLAGADNSFNYAHSQKKEQNIATVNNKVSFKVVPMHHNRCW